jgi:hypothetical protein
MPDPGVHRLTTIEKASWREHLVKTVCECEDGGVTMPNSGTNGLRRFDGGCLMRDCHDLRLMLVFVLGVFALGSVCAAQADADRPPPFSDRSVLRIVAVDVQPPNPGPDTLCRLRVRLRNSSKEPASDLSFRVTINGQRLANYVNHTFRTTLEPGKDTDLPLYNFWSSEAGRPYPSDGRLVIEVRVIGARWLDPRSKNPGGTVEPLPPPFSVTLTRGGQR